MSRDLVQDCVGGFGGERTVHGDHLRVAFGRLDLPALHGALLPVGDSYIKDARAIPDGAPNIGFRAVGKQLQRFDGQFELAEPKTARSRRTLAPPTTALLGCASIDNANLMSGRVKRKTNDRDGTLVVWRDQGGPLEGTVITHQFHRLLDKVGLPQRRFHDLRQKSRSTGVRVGRPW